jgi:hypothetical protein
MTSKTTSLSSYLPVFVPLILLATLVVFMIFYTSKLDVPYLDLAITADLLLTVPLLYLLAIWRTTIPKLTVVPVMLIGLLLGSFLLPAQNQQYLQLFREWVLPFVELAVLSYIILRVRKAVKAFNRNHTGTADFYDTLLTTVGEMLPRKAVMPVVMEISVFYYGFFSWRKRKPGPGEYTCYKESGSVTLLAFVLFLVVVETVVLHILLSTWSTIAAWVLTFMSMYSGLQIFGILKSLPQRPIVIRDGKLQIRYGILSSTTIDIDQIEEIALDSKDRENEPMTARLSPLAALEGHNVIIKLKSPNTLKGLYGIRKKYDTLLLSVDQKEMFAEQVSLEMKRLDVCKRP